MTSFGQAESQAGRGDPRLRKSLGGAGKLPDELRTQVDAQEHPPDRGRNRAVGKDRDRAPGWRKLVGGAFS